MQSGNPSLHLFHILSGNMTMQNASPHPNNSSTTTTGTEKSLKKTPNGTKISSITSPTKSFSRYAQHGLLRIQPLLPHSLLITHPSTQPLLINAPPSLLRYSNQHKIKKFFQISTVLLSSLDIKSMSGLCGWILTRMDVKRTQGKKQDAIDFYAPKGLFKLLESFGWFLRRDMLTMNVHEFTNARNWNQILEDEVLSMRSIVFYQNSMDSHSDHPSKHSDSFEANEKELLPLEADEGNTGAAANSDAAQTTKRRRIQEEESLNWPSWKVRHMNPPQSSHQLSPQSVGPNHKPNDTIMHYALHVKDTKGRFLPKEAKKLGLKAGPLFGKLSNGHSVTLENGTVIHPEEVHSPSQRGAVILIIFCTEPFFDQLLRRQADFKDYAAEGSHPASYVFHMTPHKLWKDPKYQQFVDTFDSQCEHIVCNDDTLYSHDIFEGSAFLQEKLSKIDDNIFRSTKTTIQPEEEINKSDPLWANQRRPAHHGLQVVAHPRDKCRIDTSEMAMHKIQEINMDDELCSYINEYKEARSKQTWDSSHPQEAVLQNLSDKEAEVVFLGTGSAIPSKYRNVTGIFVNFFERGGMFLDCGEGSYEQLCRVYGRKDVKEKLLNLKMVHISHMHADHHMGLLEVLERRADLCRERSVQVEPLMIIGPGALGHFLQGVSESAHERHFNYEFLSSHDLMPHEGRTQIPQRLQDVKNQLELDEFYNIRVNHSCLAYGVILKHKNGWKLVFSGDTRPCSSLVEHGKDATILIHEATHDDELQHEAVARKHSTTNEAIAIGEEMNAYRTVLTHFSQRYPKFPKLQENVADHVGIAFDLCKLNLKDLKTFPKALPAMKKFFEETVLMDDTEELPDTDHL